jgi:hypothetical protein
MNPVRKGIHALMAATGWDHRIDAWAVNAWHERRRQRACQSLSCAEGNQWLLQALSNGRPFAAGKMGSSECWALAWHLQLRRFYKYTWQVPSFGELDLAEQSGVFPNSPEMFHRFADTYLQAVASLDLAGVWFNIGEHQILQRQVPTVTRSDIRALEPWFSPQCPWSSALAGRRVLVVHPFEQTIRRQYGRRLEVWAGQPEMLPEFELRTLKAPYGFSKTGFGNWMEMLAWMEGEMERIDRDEGFDVALVGCGAAGIPLAAKAKSLGKAGVHLGGALQLLFGIRGQRWDQRAEFQPFFNDAWCRPDESEKPVEFSKVDRGGYW